MRNRSKTLAVLAALIVLPGLWGQSVLHGIKDGAWYPVMEIRGRQPVLFTGDGLERGSREDLALLPASEFGEGFIRIEVLANTREGVTSRDGQVMFLADRSWYAMKARVVADRDMPNSFFAMRFEAFGEVSYVCKPIGDLKAGRARTIEVFMKVGYEMPQQLHLFSGMDEIRTSLVPTYYRYRQGEFMLAAN